MTAQEYTRHALRLRAYRRALYRFLWSEEVDKAAAILPRLKIAEAVEEEFFNRLKNNSL